MTTRRDRTRRGGVGPGLPGALGELHESARYGSYFECLRISPDASTTEVREAYLRLVADLESMRSAAGLSPADLDALDEVVQVAQDAFDVLSNPDLRLSYRRALSGD